MRIRRLAFAAALGLWGGPAAATDEAVAAAVKATYLVKFAHYVAWPAAAINGASAPLVLCMVGRDPFGAAIDRAAQGERVDQHRIVVRRLPTIDRASGCHIAFLTGGAEQALAVIDGTPVLSVTDADETRARGIVQFEQRAGHIGFHLDDTAAQRGGLTISSRLLSIALSVRSREGRS